MEKKIKIKSWRKTVLIILVVLFTCSTISLFTTTYHYRRQVNETFINENEYLCEKWGKDIDVRLNLIYEQVKDILINTYSDTEYSKYTDQLDFYSAQKLTDTLQNKMISSNDISSIFFYDINSDYYIYSSNNRSYAIRLPMMKSYIKEQCQQDYHYLSDNRFTIKQIGGRYYLYIALKLGRFIVGAVSDCVQYSFSEDGVDASCYFIDEDTTIFLSGREEMIEGVDITDLSSRYDSNKMITSYTGSTDITGMMIRERKYNNSNIIISLLFVFNAIASVALIIVLFSYMQKRIVVPTDELIRATTEVSKGNIDYMMDESSAGSREFEELYVKFNNMTRQIGDLKIEQYDLKLNEEQNRLKMLRAQVRPHTFLNGLTTISNLSYDNNNEKIRDYIFSFSQFTRYMLHTDSEWVSISEEINHINNYIKMQQIRFPESVSFSYDVTDEIAERQVPFLLMFTLVENCCKHSMNMVQTLNIHITCQKHEDESSKGILIWVDDDGDGFPEEVLENFTKKNINTKEHLGLTNVRYTLNLLYQRDDLLKLSNKENGGARVEMYIPERG